MAARDDLAVEYLDRLPYPPYPVQEEALLAWFTGDEGVLVCAPTGTGKTLIAEAAVYEALRNNQTIYYTTPLIALTEQKFTEMQAAAVRWGFDPRDVGLVTGNRRVNPGAKVLVVVAEILLNRLLHAEEFDFAGVAAVVMDEFHNFNDPERGMVWELSLAMLPKHVRLLLLSATVGNAVEFLAWLRNSHQRRIDLVQSTQRKVPLTYIWVGEQLLGDQVEQMCAGTPEERLVPTLLFAFNREACWSTAEQLKGLRLMADGQQARLTAAIEEHDFSRGAGPKLKQLLLRGVGVHHAGVLPKHRRLVEELFQQKLLSVCVCTETLAAGINLPARSVVLTSLVKGPPANQRLIDPSTAQQIFGRAGRPQFDTQGFVVALAHEDDVRIAKWKEKYDSIPEDTKDPGLMKAKKALKKKMPTRRANETYWNEPQFEKLRSAPAASLSSRGALPWRLLAYLLNASPDVDLLRKVVHQRLMPPKQKAAAEIELERMLGILWAADYVELDPPPPEPGEEIEAAPVKPVLRRFGLLGQLLEPLPETAQASTKPVYRAHQARPTPKLARLLHFRSVNPLYGDYLVEQFALADEKERLQALESVLDLPRSLGKRIWVPGPDYLPPGPLATQRLDPELISRGLVSARLLGPVEENDEDAADEEEVGRPPPLAEKLRLVFDATLPGVTQLTVNPVWVAGELQTFGGDFYQYVSSNDLAKQEGMIFRHLLRLVLLLGEFAPLTPPGRDPIEWKAELDTLAGSLAESCRLVDPQSTDDFIERAATNDLLADEHAAPVVVSS